MPRSSAWRRRSSCDEKRRRISSAGSRRADLTMSLLPAPGAQPSCRQRDREASPQRSGGGRLAAVGIRAVHKHFGSTHVIRGVDFDIADAEFCVLVGPSGCGKSTLLRMIAGLEEISEGEIAIGARVVNRVPPKERDIAMVFQNYALYPHMTVRNNMSFALMLAKQPKAEIEARVKKAAD